MSHYPYDMSGAQKQAELATKLRDLCNHHRNNCAAYARILNASGFDEPTLSSIGQCDQLPYIPVRLFKTLDLRSVEASAVVKTLTSSGTTGQAVSRVYLDAPTATSQTRALVEIMSSFLGKQRLPMVVIDSKDLLSDRTKFNARAAGILGFSGFGRDHCYLLDAQLRPNWETLNAYLQKHSGSPIFFFGFTFVVWQSLVEAAKRDAVCFDAGAASMLLHGGGWKRLADRNIDSAQFKSALRELFGIRAVMDYYGMVEQVGSIFVECEQGHLHTPNFADVVIRDRSSLQPLGVGDSGLIQVLSTLPRSYPGHSLLTEDLGVLLGEDNCPCGRRGKYFRVRGRLPNVEIRGCSDTRSVPAMAAPA